MNTFLKKTVTKMFTDYNPSNMKSDISKFITKLSKPKYKKSLLFYLKTINSNYTKLQEGEKKQNIKQILDEVVAYYAKKGQDVNCMLDITFCSNTELSGACGFLASQSKVMVAKSKEYQDKLQKVSKALKDISNILK